MVQRIIHISLKELVPYLNNTAEITFNNTLTDKNEANITDTDMKIQFGEMIQNLRVISAAFDRIKNIYEEHRSIILLVLQL